MDRVILLVLFLGWVYFGYHIAEAIINGRVTGGIEGVLLLIVVWLGGGLICFVAAWQDWHNPHTRDGIPF